MTIKIFVTSNIIAIFPCSKCGKSYQKDVSKYIGHETQVKLKYKCKCQNSFSVLLERRTKNRPCPLTFLTQNKVYGKIYT